MPSYGGNAEARRALTNASGERDQAAADLGITEWINKLAELTEAVHTRGQALAEFWPAIKAEADARKQLAIGIERVDLATRIRNLRGTQLVDAKGKAAAAEEKCKTLESTVGAAVREVQRKLEQATKGLEEVRNKKEEATREHSDKKSKKPLFKPRLTKHLLI